MKLAGFLLLLAGWAIVMTAIGSLPAVSARSGFVLAGVGIELLGMVLVIRAHIPVVEEKR
jgi:hypothetical protein